MRNHLASKPPLLCQLDQKRRFWCAVSASDVARLSPVQAYGPNCVANQGILASDSLYSQQLLDPPPMPSGCSFSHCTTYGIPLCPQGRLLFTRTCHADDGTSIRTQGPVHTGVFLVGRELPTVNPDGHAIHVTFGTAPPIELLPSGAHRTHVSRWSRHQILSQA